DDIRAIGKAAQVDVGDGIALAGMDVLGRQNDVEIAVLLDDIAFAQRGGDDLDHYSSLFVSNARRRGRAVSSARNGVFVRPLPHLDENRQPKHEGRMSQNQPSPWWSPSIHADRRPILLARGRIEAEVRAWLAAHDFLMVDPPGLQLSPGNETHLHAFGTTMIGNDGVGQAMYLHTSPEFTMKKLLAAGERR